MLVKAARIPKPGNLNTNLRFDEVIVIRAGRTNSGSGGYVGQIPVAPGQDKDETLEKTLEIAEGMETR